MPGSRTSRRKARAKTEAIRALAAVLESNRRVAPCRPVTSTVRRPCNSEQPADDLVEHRAKRQSGQELAEVVGEEQDPRAREAKQLSLGGTSDDHQHETALPLRGAIGGAPFFARRISTARRRAGILRGVAERSNAARHAACEWREPSGRGFLCAVPHVDPNIWLEGQRNGTPRHEFFKNRYLLKQRRRLCPRLSFRFWSASPCCLWAGITWSR